MRRFLITVLFGASALAIGCGGGSGSQSTGINTIAPAANNVQPIVVDGGSSAFQTANGGPYVDAAFVTITVCVHSTTSCNTIDHVLVDTGSIGLRILSSSSGGELTATLPTASVGGNPLAECVQFVDTTFLWGPVATADVKIAGEVASSVPVHIVGDTSFSSLYPVPTTCDTGNPSGDDDSLIGLGANGVLGVGSEQFDCGACTATAIPAFYYGCPSTGCASSVVTFAQEVQNPVSFFSADNNGVIIELPTPTGAEASESGSLVFGIGTQSNNGIGSATVLTLSSQDNDTYDEFTTSFNGSTMSQSFIDSGSNGYYFDDNSLQECTSSTDFYCPATPTTLSATNSGANGGSSPVSFSVTNADNIFSSFPNDAVIPGLAGLGVDGGNFTSFDWGLPFFFGRNLFTSIRGSTAPGGATPYWAY